MKTIEAMTVADLALAAIGKESRPMIRIWREASEIPRIETWQSVNRPDLAYVQKVIDTMLGDSVDQNEWAMHRDWE
jgi:hypothetical protein